ncbi:MAG: Fic family protein, partial [Alphaproteobacteria bacterium]
MIFKKLTFKSFVASKIHTCMLYSYYQNHKLIGKMRKYIHELSDWADFRWDEAKVQEPLARVSRLQGKLLGRMGNLGFDIQNQATVAVLSEDVVETSAIEGERLDRASVRSSVGKRFGVDTGLPETKDHSGDGVVQLLFDATQKSHEPLTAERLWHWHRLLFPTGLIGYDTRFIVGGWRRGAMSVLSGAIGKENVHFQAPDAERLPTEMTQFLHWFNSEPISARERLDPILRSAIAHLWFVTLHPFDDGNGRIARAIADLQLTRGDQTNHRFYSMSRQIKAEQQAYYDILESTQGGTLDITGWLLWYIGCLERANNDAIKLNQAYGTAYRGLLDANLDDVDDLV